MHKCKYCQGKAKLIHKGTRDNPDIDVYKCMVCETKFLVVTGEYIADYENGFMYATNGLGKLSIEERLKRMELDDKRRYSMVKDLCTRKSILDFGCGFGGFLTYVVNDSERCCGVELGREEREYLNTVGIECKKSIDEYEEKFDIITLFHVFEHLEEPDYYLRKFKQFLNPDGLLIIEVPNANDALLELYESEKFADFTYWSAHMYLYTRDSLKNIIQKDGDFECILDSQIQRYPLSNHLHWLAKGLPGGHDKWSFFNDTVLIEAYEKKLREMGMCDTLYMIFKVVKEEL